MVRTGFYLGTHAALLVFDLANKNSFEELENWVRELFQNGTRGKVPLIIVGNKKDLVPQISKYEIENFLDNHTDFSDTFTKLNYYDTSALTGENVDATFERLGRICIEKYGWRFSKNPK